MLYLDHAATSFPKPPEVLDAVSRWYRELGVDAARGTSERHEAVQLEVAECRHQLHKLTGMRNVAFTSGTTEALNLFLRGFLDRGDVVWSTALEHNAVVRPLHELSRSRDIKTRWFRPDPAQPAVTWEQIATALNDNAPPRLLVYNHASNVTGAIQDFSPIASELRAAGARVLVDCAQSAGSLDLTGLDADAIALSGHKGLYGPPGIGALCMREDLGVSPLLAGGTGSDTNTDEMPDDLPGRLESGTPNTPGIFGLNAGLRFVATRSIAAIHAHENEWIDLLRERLTDLERAGKLALIGADPEREHTAVLSVVIEGVDPLEAAMALEQHGILVRAGFHCAAYVHDVLGTQRTGTVRISPGMFNAIEEVDAVAAAIGVTIA
jgi:selenocysteine lyase/cysteine desulfurase